MEPESKSNLDTETTDPWGYKNSIFYGKYMRGDGKVFKEFGSGAQFCCFTFNQRNRSLYHTIRHLAALKLKKTSTTRITSPITTSINHQSHTRLQNIAKKMKSNRCEPW